VLVKQRTPLLPGFNKAVQVGRTVINFSVKSNSGSVPSGRRDALQEVALDDDEQLPSMREMPNLNRQATRAPEQDLAQTGANWAEEDYQLQLAILQSQMPDH
jgi:hypothetical protein